MQTIRKYFQKFPYSAPYFPYQTGDPVVKQGIVTPYYRRISGLAVYPHHFGLRKNCLSNLHSNSFWSRHRRDIIKCKFGSFVCNSRYSKLCKLRSILFVILKETDMFIYTVCIDAEQMCNVCVIMKIFLGQYGTK